MDFTKGGKVIQRLRNERGLTQEELADLAETSTNTMGRIERGERCPSLTMLVKICNLLQTTADTILCGYIDADADIRWTPLTEKLQSVDSEKQNKIEAILNFLIDTL